MIRYADKRITKTQENMRGGHGFVSLSPIGLPDDFRAPVTMFNRVTLAPGASIGYHTHTDDEEYYYILSGTGEYSDNGHLAILSAGDATVTSGGEGHSLRNIGDEELDLLAVIVKVS